MFTRAHDYAHAHAIVDMQLKLFTRVCRSTREQTHAHRHACPRAHIYAHSHKHALSCHVPRKDLSSSYN